ncbi:MAG: glutaredoxin family protein [Gammaproteobacteria bacterium]|nr:glutaredoxin family protein [Gammaproteobacteria bacterium]MBU1602544.1 glutaredoxin family protein [Gammaproteobacteria bacterium]MBU2433349.1 glutaredoxin family protein [Gammaproteobacteria bacterium]MBU2451265.1 glutaredoxin family protein [Gammaproteobacteria bacterium]
MRYLLPLCLVLAAAGVQADTYRWTDSAGRTVVSDTPPVGKATGVVKLGGKPEASDGLSFATKRAMELFPVTLYTAADCVAECKNARDLLNGRGTPFTEKMLQKPEDFEELKQLVGDVFLPSLKVGKQSFRGFEAGAYNNLLDLAGYPKSAARITGGDSK